MKQNKRKQCADARRGKRRENRDRVYIAFVENSENEIHDDQRGADQKRHGRERLLEGLRIALERRVDRRRNVEFGLGFLDRLGGLAQRRSLREIEADGDGRELALMAYRQGLDGVGGPLRECGKRYLAIGRRRTHENPVERRRITLQRRRHLHDHVVARQLREILCDLALAERIVKRVVYRLRSKSIPRGLVAIDLEGQRQTFRLLIARDIAQFRQSLELGQDFRRLFIELFDVRALQRVLVLRARCAAADTNVLGCLQEEPR